MPEAPLVFPSPIRALCADAVLASRLHALGSTPFGEFACSDSIGLDGLPAVPAGAAEDLMLVVPDAAEAMPLVDVCGHDMAVVVVAADGASERAPERFVDWLEHGVEDVLSASEWADGGLPRRLRAAVERKRLERGARTDYATDLDTGLPHQQQLIEHMSQLLALREREPAPMAVLALRLEGLATAEAAEGREAANVLRRKIAVRLRGAVRASDVVASLGDDSFAVLLGSVLTPADAERVGAKLLRVLLDPFKVAGEDVSIAAALGIGRYPDDGAQPEALLRRATGLAASAQASGRAGFSRLGAAGDAANDGALPTG